MYYVYVLKSTTANRVYVGVSEDPQRRLQEHNFGKTRSTKPYVPYKIIYLEKYSDKKIALQRERQIKRSGKLRDEIKRGVCLGPIV